MSDNEKSYQIISGNSIIDIPRGLIPEIPDGTPNDEVVEIIITALESYVAKQGNSKKKVEEI